jgi:aryl-alcohol dehydrogenase-like predicted oxidoreductase
MDASRLAGRATPEATRAHLAAFTAHAPHGQTALGETGLLVSRIGFGGYRVDDETPEHRLALRTALLSGCNLIDTSTNYTDGGSERLVGDVLHELTRDGRLRREAVVVVSKIGYVQGENLRLAMDRERAGSPFPAMVKYMDGCWHCIHPEFLEDQLERSLARLRLSTLDVCLLHNPEYFFSDAKKHRVGETLDVLRGEFYRRLGEAFAFLEEAVRRGSIGGYGVSSNSVTAAADDPEATSVSFMLKAALEAGGPGHHFRVLQLPMNLLESGGALLLNTGPERGQTALEAAGAAGLAVLINRPLNAIVGNHLVRLAGGPADPPSGSVEDRTAELKSLEEEYRTQIATPAGTPQDAVDPFFDLIDQLAGLPAQIEDLEHWRQVEQQYVVPRINHTARAMGREIPADLQGRWTQWWSRCMPSLEGLLQAIAREASKRSRSRTSPVTDALDPLLPEARRAEPLSRKAIWALRSTPGVTSILVGMRRTEYVQDALAVLGWPPLDDPLEVYRRVRRTRVK